MGDRAREGTARVLFAIDFESPMAVGDAEILSRELGMDTAPQPKVPPVPRGVVRLSFASGLFLVAGETEARWRLECRSWGDPAPATVRRWMLQALQVARRLDRAARPDGPQVRPSASIASATRMNPARLAPTT